MFGVRVMIRHIRVFVGSWLGLRLGFSAGLSQD